MNVYIRNSPGCSRIGILGKIGGKIYNPPINLEKIFITAGDLEWKLVRSVPQGTTWHPATDGLQGTDVYGVETDLSQPFSKQFDNVDFNQVISGN